MIENILLVITVAMAGGAVAVAVVALADASIGDWSMAGISLCFSLIIAMLSVVPYDAWQRSQTGSPPIVAETVISITITPAGAGR